MASIAQLSSEIVHSLGQPNNKALRENVKLLIVHTRNELIRRSYENHKYVDKGLTQRFVVSLIDVPDGDIKVPHPINDIINGEEHNHFAFPIEYIKDFDITKIKRTKEKVPRPIRLINNLPFDRVSSVGFSTSKEFPFIKETSARFRRSVPGLNGTVCYDYINGFIYLFPVNNKNIPINSICIEGAFENPTLIELKNHEINGMNVLYEDSEFLLPEDMIGQIKEIIYKRDLVVERVRETDEIPDTIKYN